MKIGVSGFAFDKKCFLFNKIYLDHYFPKCLGFFIEELGDLSSSECKKAKEKL